MPITDLGVIIYPDPVKEALFCEEVRIPQAQHEATDFSGCGDQFKKEVPRIEFYTRIIGAQQDTTIFHRWIYRGRELLKKSLTITSPNFRTKSSKGIDGHTGVWKVQILSQDERVLSEKSFTILSD